MEKKIFEDGKIINLVTFYSEGPPNDNGLNLSSNRDRILEKKIHFNNISMYTPKILKNLGYNKYVKEYEDSGLNRSHNPGMHKIGNCAWRPKILLLELEKMNEGDIIIYRDMNIIKYPILDNYDGIRNLALRILDIVNFDFFVPRENSKLKNYTKTNIIRELGDNHQFSYNFPGLCVNFLIIRKSNVSIELINEWKEGCLTERWIDPFQYGELDTTFLHSTPEQSILGIIIANWVRKRKHNIDIKYPKIGFMHRDIYQMFYYNDYDYLKLLDDSINVNTNQSIGGKKKKRNKLIKSIKNNKKYNSKKRQTTMRINKNKNSRSEKPQKK